MDHERQLLAFDVEDALHPQYLGAVDHPHGLHDALELAAVERLVEHQRERADAVQMRRRLALMVRVVAAVL